MMNNIKPHLLTALVVFIIIASVYLVMVFKFPVAYIFATYEDFVGEWAQVFLFSFTLYFSLRLCLARTQYQLFFGVLAVACFYVVGEEISWGQRIFDVETPEFFMEHNLQQETNLHNFLVGPYGTLTKQLIELIMAAGLVFFGLIYPLLVKRGWRLALCLKSLGLPPAPFYLWPFFVTAAFLELRVFSFNEEEVAEILVSCAMAIYSMHYWFLHKHSLDETNVFSINTELSQRLAKGIVMAVVAAVLFATTATYACFSTDHLKVGMENRFMRGLDKFAKRYERHQRWDIALELYLLLNEKDPDQVPVLRHIAYAYDKLGEQRQSRRYLKQVLTMDLERLKRRPLDVPLHVSLAQTYDILNDKTKSKQYLETALTYAQLGVEQYPDNPIAIYWLGRVNEIMENYSVALNNYRRAAELSPQTLRYRDAYLDLKLWLDKQ